MDDSYVPDWAKGVGSASPASPASPEVPDWALGVKIDTTGDTVKGFKRSFAQLPEFLYGTAALTSMTAENLFGEGGISTAAKNYFGQKFAAKQEENQKYAPAVEFTDAWDRLKEGDLGSMADWLQDSVGYVLGQGIQTLATGGVGALAGKAVLAGATEKMLGGVVAKQASRIAEEAAVKQGLRGAAAEAAIAAAMPEATKIAAQRTAQAIGAGVVLNAQNLGMEAGDIYGGLTEESAKTGKPITGDDLLRAWGAAAAAAGTETATDMLGLGALTGRIKIGGKSMQAMTGVGGRAARGATAAAIGAPLEGGQEFVQTGLEQWGAGKPLDTPEAQKERINAAAVGAVGGTVMGGGIGAIQGATDPVTGATSPAIRAIEKSEDASAGIINRVMSAPTVDTAIAQAAASLNDGASVTGMVAAQAKESLLTAAAARAEEMVQRQQEEDAAYEQADRQRLAGMVAGSGGQGIIGARLREQLGVPEPTGEPTAMRGGETATGMKIPTAPEQARDMTDDHLNAAYALTRSQESRDLIVEEQIRRAGIETGSATLPPEQATSASPGIINGAMSPPPAPVQESMFGDTAEPTQPATPKAPTFEPIGPGAGALPPNAPVPSDWRKKWRTLEVEPGKWRIAGRNNANPFSPAFKTEAEAEVWADRESAQQQPAAKPPKPPKSLMNNPPPGGWTDADKVPKKPERWEGFRVTSAPREGRFFVGEDRGDGTMENFAEFSISGDGKPTGIKYFHESPSTRDPALKAMERAAQAKMRGDNLNQPAGPSDKKPRFGSGATDTLSEAESELRDQSHKTEQPGDVLLGNGQYVSFDAVVALAREGIQSGQIKPMPAQINFKLDVAMRDVDRVLAAATRPTKATIRPTRNGIMVQPRDDAGNPVGPEHAASQPPASAPSFGASNTVFTSDAAARARELLKKKLGNINAGIDPETMQAGITLAGYYIEGGARSFAAYSAKMVADLGENIRPYLKSFYAAVRSWPGFDAKGMDTDATIDKGVESIAELDEAQPPQTPQEPQDGKSPNTAGSGPNPAGGGEAAGTGRPGRDPGAVDPDGVEGVKPEDGGAPDRPGDTGSVRGDLRGPQAGDGTGVSDGGDATGGSGGGSGGGTTAAGSGTAGAGGQPGVAGADSGAGGDGAGGTKLPANAPAGQPPKKNLGNYHIDDPERVIGAGGPKARFAKNKAAIEAFNAAHLEDRDPTPAERDAMAGYIGWGAFGQELFKGNWQNPDPKDGWSAEDKWLRDHLGKEQWESAQRSIINAHYTDPPTVKTIWAMIRKMGFKGGRVLEPSMGIGNFYGLMPRDLMERSKLAGIEMDTLTGGMAKMMYPDASIHIKGYQESQTADNFYDLIVGNWPFAADGPVDRRYMQLTPSLHDYFFLKALDQVRPGGLVVGITSAGTMDKMGRNIRLELAKKGELIASFRMPSGAFEKYAGTAVVTDLIILRKRATPSIDTTNAGWIESVKHPIGDEEINLNEYYENNPENILGKLNWGHGTTSGRPGMIVERQKDFAQQLETLPSRVPADAFQTAKQAKVIDYSKNETGERQNAIIQHPDTKELSIVQGEHLAPLDQVHKWKTSDKAETKKRESEIVSLIGLRRAYADLIAAESTGTGDIEASRKNLRAQYEAYDKKYGRINRKGGAVKYLLQARDPHYVRLAALESNKGDKKNPRWEPAKIIFESTMRKATRMDEASVKDAFVMARNQSLDVDIEAIAKMAKTAPAVVIDELQSAGAIWKTPGGTWEVSDVYLSGNVRRKLREAEEAQAAGQDMARNIKALKAAIPPTVPYYLIEAKMGAPWVAPEEYRAFIAELIGLKEKEAAQVDMEFRLGSWRVNFDERGAINHRPEAQEIWGVRYYPFSRIVEAAMNNLAITIRGRDDKGNVVVDDAATAEVNEKVTRLREEFSTWAFKDSARRIRLETNYNEVMNAIADSKFDGSFLTMPGMSLNRGDDPLSLREHQMNAIWRGLVNRRGIYAHEVGTGKTYTMGGIAVESRRYGLARKTLLFAHNANARAVANEIQQMYPAASVLFVDNLSPDNIDVTLQQIANDDWDVIVVPHSLVDRFALKRETLMEIAAEQIAQLEEEALQAAADDGVNLTVEMMNDEQLMKRVRSPTAKELVHARQKIIQMIEKQAIASSREGAIAFEDLGVDQLMIDEVQSFKKPPLATKMRVKGLNKATSNRSIGISFLTSYVKRLNGGTGIHVFTGTPITNTLNEIYNLQKMVADDLMEKDGVKAWDAWFNTFADSGTDVELTPAGEYEAITRLASFVNVAELRRMISNYTDIVFADDMPEFVPRTTESGKTLKSKDITDAERTELYEGRSEQPVGRPYKKIINDVGQLGARQLQILNQLVEYANDWKQASKKDRREMMLSGDPRSPILVETAAANAGLDARLTDMAAPDDPGSKENRVVKNVTSIYKESEKATQVIFVDRGYSDERVSRKAVRGSPGQVTVTRRPGFNLVKSMVAKLVAGGIPEAQIAVVNGDVSKEKRTQIAADMNTGKIRVVIGLSTTLGVGVNMQENLRAMHHMDAPWTPGDLEQRNGRGWRQGNKWNTVIEYRYITERLDGRRWQVLAIKERFIKAFLKADSSVRIIDGDATDMSEEGDGISDLQQSLSEAAGDPRTAMREKLRKEIDKLDRRERAHVYGTQDTANRARTMAADLRQEKRELEGYRADMDAIKATEDQPFEIEVDGKTFTERKEAQEAIDAIVKGLEASTRYTNLGKIRGFEVSLRYPFKGATVEAVMTRKDNGSDYVPRYGAKASVASFEAVMRNMGDTIVAKVEKRIADMEESIPRLEAASRTPFQQAEKLEKKKEALRALEIDLDRNPVPPPSWLRHGAPVGTNVYVNGDEYVVEGHVFMRSTYGLIVGKDGQPDRTVPYDKVTDENGIPKYEAHPFDKPAPINRIKKGTRLIDKTTKEVWVVERGPFNQKDSNGRDVQLVFAENQATKSKEERRVDQLEFEPVKEADEVDPWWEGGKKERPLAGADRNGVTIAREPITATKYTLEQILDEDEIQELADSTTKGENEPWDDETAAYAIKDYEEWVAGGREARNEDGQPVNRLFRRIDYGLEQLAKQEPLFSRAGASFAEIRSKLREDHPGVTMRFAMDTSGAVALLDIKARNEGRGDGPRALADFVAWLDATGRESSLLASPGGDIPLPKLVALYKRYGYIENTVQQWPGSVVMHRMPKEVQNAQHATQRPESTGRSTAPGPRGLEAPQSGSRAAQTAEAVKKALGVEIGKSSRIEVLQSVGNLPAGLSQKASRAGGKVQGIYDPATGKLYLIADNIAPGRELAVLLHEGAHMGLAKLLGAEQHAKLAKLVRLWASHGGDTEHGRIARAALARIPGDTKADRLDEEAIAYFVEEAVKAGHGEPSPTEKGAIARWLRELFDAVRAAIKRLGANPSKLTVDDVVAMARGALQQELAPTQQTETEESARAKGFTLKAYRGVDKSKPFNDSGTVWATTNREVAAAYAEEVFGYDDADVIEVMVKTEGIPRSDIRKMTEEQAEALERDQFGNPQKIGIYHNSDDSPLGSGYPHTAIHVPAANVVVIGEQGNALESRAPTKQTDTPAFLKWFGQSVVTVDGKVGSEPLVVYHGQQGLHTIKSFRNKATWFVDNPEYASRWANLVGPNDKAVAEGITVLGAPKVYPVYLNIKNAYDAINGDLRYMGDYVDAEMSPYESGLRDFMESKGYDGIKQEFHNRDGSVKETVWVAFRPEQIKSAIGNRGTFDGGNTNILFSVADAQKSPRVAGMVSALLQSSGKLGVLNGINTQYHKALMLARKGLPEFKAVFDETQDYLNDITSIAVTAEQWAPGIFRELRGIGLKDMKDYFKGAASEADIAATQPALHVGTLFGGGNPLEGRKWTDAELKFGGAILRGSDNLDKVPSSFKREIKRTAGGEMRLANLFTPLTDKQIELYRQARATIDQSLEDQAKSIIYRQVRGASTTYDNAMGQKKGRTPAVMFDKGMALDDVGSEVAVRLQEMIDDLSYRIELLGQEDKPDAALIRRAEAGRDDLETLKKTLKAIEKKANGLIDHAYTPVMRFGNRVVVAKDADGKTQFVGFYDGNPLVPKSADVEMNKAAAALRAENPTWTVTTERKSERAWELYSGLNLDALENFLDFLDPETKAKLERDATIQEYMKNAVNSRSTLTRMIHRKGTPGFSTDIPRTLASFITSNARSAAGNYHGAEMKSLVEDIKQGDVKDEAADLVTYVLEPKEEAAKLRSFLFFHFLGGSIAAGIVNLSQTPMMTTPALLAHAGMGKVTAALTKAAKAAVRDPKTVEGAAGKALARAELEGVTAPQMVHHLTATAANNPFSSNRHFRTFMTFWGGMFSATEVFNRRVAFLAAYDIGVDKKVADPYDFAKNLVADTQLLYNKGNRPNLGRGTVGAVVLTFKTFTIGYLELLRRLPPQQQLMMLGLLLLMAGAEGLPFAEDIEDLVDTLGQALGYTTNTSKWLGKTIRENLGPEFERPILHGLGGMLPIALHSRLGFGNILPATAYFKASEIDKSRDVAEAVGPVGSVLKSFSDSLQMLARGRWDAAAVNAAPKAVRDAVNGGMMFGTGEAEDSKGRLTLKDVTAGEALGKAVGFNPQRAAKESEVKREAMLDKNLRTVRMDEIAGDWADGIVRKEPGKVDDAKKRLREWNQSNPDLRIDGISMAKSVGERVRAARMTGEQRFLKSMPKSMRDSVRQEFQQ